MPFAGSCHCGAISYTVDEELPTSALACNCSICRRKAPLQAMVEINLRCADGVDPEAREIQHYDGASS